MSPYALTDPKDGERPGYRLIDDPTDALPGEVVVDDPPGENEVWDSGTGGLRPKRDAEELAELKESRRAELEAAFASECEASFPSLWAALGVIAASPQDARVTALKARAAKLQTRLAAVDAATTEAAVGAISWT